MTTPLTLPAVWLFFALWQSTLCLGVSLVLARWCVKTPWRGHVLLCTGIFAAVLAPTLSTLLAFHNGMITPSLIPGVQDAGLNASGMIMQNIAANVLGGMFLAGMLLFLLLLGYGVMMSRRLMFRARPFPDRESQEALLAGAKVLQNVSLPILFTSDQVKSPTVWCWGLHPAVLLPEELTAAMPPEERDAVFLHELAHITRRDHLAALFCRLSGLLLFWNPLWWLALRQSDLLADEACDLLVLSRGVVSPGDYSEILLKLAAGTQTSQPVFQFLSRKERMMKRIDTILDFAERPNLANVGSPRLWTSTVVTLACLLCVGLAFCQEGKKEIWKTPDDVGHTHLALFEPVGDFDPKTPQELLNKLNTTLFERKDVPTGYFRTGLNSDQKLVGRICTNNPQGLKEVIEAIPELKLTKIGALTEEVFAKHTGTNLSEKNVSNTPKIVKMEPANGATDVDAATVKELRVTFDRDMNTGGFSWTGGGESFPKTTGEPKWINKRTCVLPVALEEGKSYTLGINSRSFRNFKSADGVAVEPVIYTFVTKSTKRIRSYSVGKKVTDFPEGTIDLLTPESAYALSNRIIGDDNPDKIERLRQYTAGMKFPENMEQWITTMTPEVRSLMINAEILHVFIYRDKQAMVIAEVVKGEKYNNRLLSKRDGHWLSVGGGGLYKGESAEAVVKMNEASFAKLADNWDKATESSKVAPNADPAASRKKAQEGWQNFMRGNPGGAEPLFLAATELDSKNANAWQGLGWSQLNMGKIDAAKKSFETCITLDKRNTAALNGLGRIAQLQGDVEKAIEYWTEGASLDPQATGPMAGLAALYDGRDDYENAIKYYEMWLRAEPNNDDAKAALKKIREKAKSGAVQPE